MSRDIHRSAIAARRGVAFASYGWSVAERNRPAIPWLAEAPDVAAWSSLPLLQMLLAGGGLMELRLELLIGLLSEGLLDEPAGVFELIAHDLRIIERVLKDRDERPSEVILDARTLPSTPESGGRAGYDGHKKKNGSKIHIAVDTLGNLLSVLVTAANQQERDQVGELAARVKQLTQGRVELAYVDQGYTGERSAQAAGAHEIELEVIKHTQAKQGFVLLPRRWVVERTFGWLGRHRRLARDYERLTATLAGYHWVAYLGMMINRIIAGSA